MRVVDPEIRQIKYGYITEYIRNHNGRTVKRGWPPGPVVPPFIWGGEV